MERVANTKNMLSKRDREGAERGRDCRGVIVRRLL